MAVKDNKFVPRQRKRKVLDRQRGRRHRAASAAADPNALEMRARRSGTAAEQQAGDAPRAELAGGVRVGGKKAKRLEKYMENKLRKDESRALLSQLAAMPRVDTSLLASARALGQTKETKREALRRALREEERGLPGAEGRAEMLYEPRGRGEEGREDGEEEEDEEDEEEEEQDGDEDELERGALCASEHGHGVKDGPEELGSAPALAKTEDESSGAESKSAEELGDAGGSEDEDEDEDEDDDDSEAAAQRRKQRSSAFKAWAHQQRNEALGYQGIDSGPSILEIPRPENFEPRPLEQDPLPRELQPTTNTSRRAYSVEVTRDADIQAARLELPVVAEEQRIMEAIHNNNLVVICGATGSGKTTQVPQFLFEAGYGSASSPTPGMIGVTQPRRVAAVSMSKRVGQELGSHGGAVAYQIRFEGTTSAKTAVKFMTDGVLLREVAQDIALRKYSAIVIDEAHERSVNTDILLGMLSRVVKLHSS
ncbi:hypothetical protein P8C59_004010 [Phyllachora maydis]|uniref:RNA helicase n=1 Tax=Phyllachora maydis TaxID=1825666 RepID=A0AAD9I1I0_9PEZI|nr:hypothetical protein P8C59_004010 [Phyllachora maydis]